MHFSLINTGFSHKDHCVVLQAISPKKGGCVDCLFRVVFRVTINYRSQPV